MDHSGLLWSREGNDVEFGVFVCLEKKYAKGGLTGAAQRHLMVVCLMIIGHSWRAFCWNKKKKKSVNGRLAAGAEGVEIRLHKAVRDLRQAPSLVALAKYRSTHPLS